MIRSWKMLNQIKNFMLDDSGLETVEWAIVGGVIVAVGAAFFITIGGHVSGGLLSLQTETALIP
jgi:pilus assembly protein Flp/PilA